MSKRTAGRLSLLFVSLLGLMSLYSATAFAAGAPTEVQASASGWGLNHVNGGAHANPNGAETTVTVEYRQAGAGSFQSAGSGSIGSGTTKKGISRLINGLKPYGYYELRAKASNEFGTVYSSVVIMESSYWQIEKVSETHVASFTSTGTAKFEWKWGGYNIKVSCNETGSGTLGGEWGTGTGYTVNLSNCRTYQNEKEICKANDAFFSVDQTFTSKSGTVGLVFPEGGCTFGEVSMQAPDPFLVEMTNFNKAKQLSQPMTLTNNLKWGSITVSATISTTWSLSGEDKGKLFGAYAGETY